MLPESWQVLGIWWWVLHVVAIGIIFGLGFLIVRHSMMPEEKNEWQKHLADAGGATPRTSSTDSPQAEP